MPKKEGMTQWYNPALLVQTGIRVAISTVFGQFADRREAMAAANAVAAQPFDSSFDYEDEATGDGFWFDFLADTGDGWDPTFAMAQLLTQPDLHPTGADHRLPRGRVQILGGDQVYATASKEEYENRFLYPFEEAYKQLGTEAKAQMPDLYAIPGNHDWYDGLAAFFGLFCRRRIAEAGKFGMSRDGKVIAGRPTNQTRSYFAIRLPNDWWLWGTDSQLEGYIDQPQIEYFQYVAAHWMKPGSKVILCVGEPAWAYYRPEQPEKKFESFSYLERLAGAAEMPKDRKDWKTGWPEPGKQMGHQLKLVLTGDAHHYARFTEDDRHYITCGGGGAFLHPTHQLADNSFDWKFPPPGERIDPAKRDYPRAFKLDTKIGSAGEALFPDRQTSKKLNDGNRSFAWRNKLMSLVFVGAYLLYNWLLHANARIENYDSLVSALSTGGWLNALWRYVALAFTSPWPLLLFITAMAGYYYFADSPWDKGKRAKIGVLCHGFPQAAVAIIVTTTLLWAAGRFLPDPQDVGRAGRSALDALTVVVASIAAGAVAATLFGLYLRRQLNKYGRHWNEAFSALAIADYKCFLRMRVGADGALHVYPVGLEKVPDGGGTPATLNPHLIEPPIVIR